MRAHSAGKRWIQSLALLMVMVGLSLVPAGCTTSLPEWVHNGFKVGPNFHEPPAPLPAKWVDENDMRVLVGNPNLATWWDVFDDPILTGLLQRSYSRNLSLRAVALQILEAKEQQAIALGELLPQTQNYVLQYTHGQVSQNGGSAANGGASGGAALAAGTTLNNFNPTLGSTIGGELEQSNVDLATEMTNMITAERGYQANSRVISTADEMLGTLVTMQ